MTLLISWIGVDTHGTASAYIAADSRVSWANVANFDYGRKVFALQNSPDILGYCGDVLFPTMVLSQISEMADRGLLFPQKPSCKERFELIKEKLVHQFHKYPMMEKGIVADVFQVIHISRDLNDNMKFECRLIEWSRSKGWSGKEIAMPSHSDILFVLVSGAKEFNDKIKRYNEGPDQSTSRRVFHCFCDTLFNITDLGCGGAPQLVGIFRKPNSTAITFGVIKEKVRYFLGTQIDSNLNFDCIEWRNDFFEICDGKTMNKLKEAQSQPDHLRRKSN